MSRSSHDEAGRARIRDRVLCAILALVTFALYARTLGFGFIDFDDNIYVFENPIVRGGLTWDGFRWALTTNQTGNWHPVTWLSLMADVSLFGLSAGAMHGVNAAIHALNGVLLFILLKRTTDRPVLSFFAAALFAWHPLRVESVAWIAERKDVLSTCFWLVTMLFYVAFVRRPDARRWLFYVGAVLALAIGLMSKGMLVTLPFALLLFDVWPLGRLRELKRRLLGRTLLGLIVEKLPLFALVVADAYVTMRFQAAGGAVASAGAISFSQRLFNAVSSYGDYLQLTAWPAGLAIFYPNPYFGGGSGIAPLKIVVSAVALVLISLGALRQWRRRPFVAVGWFWFLGTLIPVIGLVQIGSQGRADRYTYVPSIGLSIAIVWLVADLTRARQRLAAAVGLIVIAALAGVTFLQVGFWKDSQTVMQRAADAVPNNSLAHTNLGAIYDACGDRVAAEREYRESLRIVPEEAASNGNLGGLLVTVGRPDEGEPYLRKAIALDPKYAPAYLSLGDACDLRGDFDAAVGFYERGLAADPKRKDGYHHYALARAQHGDIDGAIKLWREALAIDPNFAAALDGYGRALLVKGDVVDAQRILRHAVQARPDAATTLHVLAWSLATDPDPALRDPVEAATLARRALAISPSTPAYADAYAAALAAQGRFKEAADLASRAAVAARSSGDVRTADAMDARAKLYSDGHAYVQPR